jgi:PIN domain nuclease of toxin-antitoxin system
VGDEPVIVLDTHALVWWAVGDRRLSAPARRAIKAAAKAGGVFASAISVMEVATAVRRGRLAFNVPFEQWLADLRSLPELRVEPVSAEIAALAGSFDGTMHGDPADRIIAATARRLGARLVTADERLRGLPDVVTVW